MVASSSPSDGGSSSRDNDGATRSETAAAKAISGMGAGVLSTVLCSPLDVAKTRVQVQTAGMGDVRYRGVLGALSTILREEGSAGWFRGIAPAVSSVAVFWAVYFPCYDVAKEKLVEVTGLYGMLKVPLLAATHAPAAPEAHPPAQSALRTGEVPSGPPAPPALWAREETVLALGGLGRRREPSCCLGPCRRLRRTRRSRSPRAA